MYGTHDHVSSSIMSILLTYPLYCLIKWLFVQASGAEFPEVWRHVLFWGVFIVTYFAYRIFGSALGTGEASESFDRTVFMSWMAMFAWTGVLWGDAFRQPWVGGLLGLALGGPVAFYLAGAVNYGAIIGYLAIPLLLVLSLVPEKYRAEVGLVVCLAAMIGRLWVLLSRRRGPSGRSG